MRWSLRRCTLLLIGSKQISSNKARGVLVLHSSWEGGFKGTSTRPFRYACPRFNFRSVHTGKQTGGKQHECADFGAVGNCCLPSSLLSTAYLALDNCPREWQIRKLKEKGKNGYLSSPALRALIRPKETGQTYLY